jgi:hypothetical protein
MKRNSKIIVFLFIALALGSFALGYLIWNKPHEDVKNADGVTTDAFSLYNSFTNDSSKAKTSFLNKILQVSGVVREVTVNQQKQQVILLKSPVQGASVNCTMEENFNTLKHGDIVVIKGICSGFSGGIPEMNIPGDVFLVRCYPIK